MGLGCGAPAAAPAAYLAYILSLKPLPHGLFACAGLPGGGSQVSGARERTRKRTGSSAPPPQGPEGDCATVVLQLYYRGLHWGQAGAGVLTAPHPPAPKRTPRGPRDPYHTACTRSQELRRNATCCASDVVTQLKNAVPPLNPLRFPPSPPPPPPPEFGAWRTLSRS